MGTKVELIKLLDKQHQSGYERIQIYLTLITTDGFSFFTSVSIFLNKNPNKANLNENHTD
jgi:hypothetical protein